MFCTSCGKQIPDGNAFCVHCGAKILPRNSARPDQGRDQYGQSREPYSQGRDQYGRGREEYSRPQRDWVPPGQEPKPGWRPPGQDTGAGWSDWQDEPEPEKKSSILPKILIGVIAVAVFFCAAFFGYRVFSGSDKGAKEDTVKEASAEKEKDKKKKDRETEEETAEASAETEAAAEETEETEKTEETAEETASSDSAADTENALKLASQFDTEDAGVITDFNWYTELSNYLKTKTGTSILDHSTPFQREFPELGQGGWKAMLVPDIGKGGTDTLFHACNLSLDFLDPGNPDRQTVKAKVTWQTSIDPLSMDKKTETGITELEGEWNRDTGEVTLDGEGISLRITSMLMENDGSAEYAIGVWEGPDSAYHSLLMTRERK